jgi:hypothetical protein
MVSVARKINTRELRQDQSSSFRRGGYRKKCQKPEKLWDSSAGENVFCTSGASDDGTEIRPKLFRCWDYWGNVNVNVVVLFCNN